HTPASPAPASIPHTVLFPGRAINPTSSVTNVVNVGAVKHGRNGSSTRRSDPGRVCTRSIDGNSLQLGYRQPPMLLRLAGEITPTRRSHSAEVYTVESSPERCS